LFFHCEKYRVPSGLCHITECGTIVALKSSIESASRRREGGEVVMDKISLFLLIGFVGWWIGNMAGQDQYAQILGAEASALEMIMGIVGATISCHLFLYTSSTR
jgi:hypothetical protein